MKFYKEYKKEVSPIYIEKGRQHDLLLSLHKDSYPIIFEIKKRKKKRKEKWVDSRVYSGRKTETNQAGKLEFNIPS
jgi:hypothetical protein